MASSDAPAAVGLLALILTVAAVQTVGPETATCAVELSDSEPVPPCPVSPVTAIMMPTLPQVCEPLPSVAVVLTGVVSEISLI